MGFLQLLADCGYKFNDDLYYSGVGSVETMLAFAAKEYLKGKNDGIANFEILQFLINHGATLGLNTHALTCIEVAIGKNFYREVNRKPDHPELLLEIFRLIGCKRGQSIEGITEIYDNFIRALAQGQLVPGILKAQWISIVAAYGNSEQMKIELQYDDSSYPLNLAASIAVHAGNTEMVKFFSKKAKEEGKEEVYFPTNSFLMTCYSIGKKYHEITPILVQHYQNCLTRCLKRIESRPELAQHIHRFGCTVEQVRELLNQSTLAKRAEESS